MATGLYDAAYEHDACGVGMVADLHGRADHDIVDKGLTVLERLAHRGASGAEASTGDGAGILVQIPHRFLAAATEAAGFSLPAPGGYAVGLAFLPRDADDAAKAKKTVAALAEEEGLVVLGWRVVPIEAGSLGETALGAMPAFEQVFVAPTGGWAGAVADQVGRRSRPRCGHGPGAPGLCPAQAGRARHRRSLFPLPVGPDAGLQGHAHLRTAARSSSPT